jgi:hypothetical protein
MYISSEIGCGLRMRIVIKRLICCEKSKLLVDHPCGRPQWINNIANASTCKHKGLSYSAISKLCIES